jgi:hypothetical protein
MRPGPRSNAAPGLTTTVLLETIMADSITSIMEARWEKALYNLHVADEIAADLTEFEDSEVHTDFEDIRFRAYLELMRTPAPSLEAVLTKLEKCWGNAMYDGDERSIWMCKIVGDIRYAMMMWEQEDIEAATHKSPEVLQSELEACVAAVTEYYDSLRDLALAEIDGAPHSAAGRHLLAGDRLLDAPARSIRGISRKLEVFWETARLDPIEGAGLERVFGDLARLANEQDRRSC